MPRGFPGIDEAGMYLQAESLSLDFVLPPTVDYPGADPVAVCLERDLQTTLDVTVESQPGLRIDTVIHFNPSMRVAVMMF